MYFSQVIPQCEGEGGIGKQIIKEEKRGKTEKMNNESITETEALDSV